MFLLMVPLPFLCVRMWINRVQFNCRKIHGNKCGVHTNQWYSKMFVHVVFFYYTLYSLYTVWPLSLAPCYFYFYNPIILEIKSQYVRNLKQLCYLLTGPIGIAFNFTWNLHGWSGLFERLWFDSAEVVFLENGTCRKKKRNKWKGAAKKNTSDNESLGIIIVQLDMNYCAKTLAGNRSINILGTWNNFMVCLSLWIVFTYICEELVDFVSWLSEKSKLCDACTKTYN